MQRPSLTVGNGQITGYITVVNSVTSKKIVILAPEKQTCQLINISIFYILFAGTSRGQLEVRVRAGLAVPDGGAGHHSRSGSSHGSRLEISLDYIPTPKLVLSEI